jgi:hypothetical protein
MTAKARRNLSRWEKVGFGGGGIKISSLVIQYTPHNFLNLNIHTLHYFQHLVQHAGGEFKNHPARTLYFLRAMFSKDKFNIRQQLFLFMRSNI